MLNTAGLVGSQAPSPFSRQKSAHVSAASNGFIVSLDNTTDYNQTFKIANSTDEVAEIIKAYFAQE